AGVRAILEDGVEEEGDRAHDELKARLLQRLLEAGDDLIALGRRGVDGHQVVVVQVDAPGADVRQHVHDVDRVDGRARLGAERVASTVSDGPQAKRKLVLRFGRIHGHASMVDCGSIPVISTVFGYLLSLKTARPAGLCQVFSCALGEPAGPLASSRQEFPVVAWKGKGPGGVLGGRPAGRLLCFWELRLSVNRSRGSPSKPRERSEVR